MNVADLLWENTDYFNANPVCVFNDAALSHADFVDKTAGVSEALRKNGIKERSRVVVLISNRPEFLISLFSIWSIGAVAVPVNTALARPEVVSIVRHCAPSLIFVEKSFLSVLDECDYDEKICILNDEPGCEWHKWASTSGPRERAIDMPPEAPALIYYTSGTTGAPKGVLHSQAAVIDTAKMFAQNLRITPSDRLLITGPMTFILHLTMNALTALAGGATVVIMEKFHPEASCTAIVKQRITVFIAVPTVYAMILNWLGDRHHDFSSVRFAVSAGASFPEALFESIRDTIGISVSNLWGMSECGPITSFNPDSINTRKPDSCGQALPGCAIRIVDDNLDDVPDGQIGEVIATSRGILTCYYNNSDATKATLVGEWVRSGDLGKVDDDGHLFIAGRKKDMIIRGGANIYPTDVEDVLYKHDGIYECAVVGVPDPIFGEAVKAFIVMKPQTSANEGEILAFCASHLAEYKVPSAIEFVGSLPKGPTGKIVRKDLTI